MDSLNTLIGNKGPQRLIRGGLAGMILSTGLLVGTYFTTRDYRQDITINGPMAQLYEEMSTKADAYSDSLAVIDEKLDSLYDVQKQGEYPNQVDKLVSQLHQRKGHLEVRKEIYDKDVERYRDHKEIKKLRNYELGLAGAYTVELLFLLISGASTYTGLTRKKE
ncbi:MAG: hypothetical protein KC535_03815 [Nanoarchaeota archaeon]|nr:hypothetical protein [Nanoarchaeota archaeon]